MKDHLQEFVALRNALMKEKQTLLQRLRQIDSALGETSPPPPPGSPRRGRPPGNNHNNRSPQSDLPKTAGRTPRPAKRIRNKISLRQAIATVTRDKPMTKEQILDAVQKTGYRFNTGNPVASLNSVLYAGKQFINDNGRFSPAKT